MRLTHDAPVMAELLVPEITEMIDLKQTGEVRATLAELQDPEVVDLLTALNPEHRMIAFRFLPRDRQAEVFSMLPADEQELLLADLSNEQLAPLLDDMTPDDRAELFAELPGEVTARLLALLKPEERRQTQFLLGYPPQSIGRLMTPDYLTIRPEWSVQQVLDHIRKRGRDSETFTVLFAVDERGRLIGEARIRPLLLADPAGPVRPIIEENPIVLHATDDREEAVRVMERYDRSALPVVNIDGALVGIVTFDDVADVAQEETTEDIQKMGGVEALDEPYASAPIGELIRKRGMWLTLLFLGETMTASAMGWFEDEIKTAVVLALFVPLIISSGGNSGSQASTLIIRAMALGEVRLRDWSRVLRRELICGLALGVLLGAIGLARIHLWHWLGWADYSDHPHRIALVVALSLIGVVIWGTLTGSMLPFLLRRLRLDPAHSSAPFVATLVDVTGVVIYFSFALLLLRGTLL